MVKINRVYTRAGDDGRTVPGDGARRPRFDLHPREGATVQHTDANVIDHVSIRAPVKGRQPSATVSRIAE